MSSELISLEFGEGQATQAVSGTVTITGATATVKQAAQAVSGTVTITGATAAAPTFAQATSGTVTITGATSGTLIGAQATAGTVTITGATATVKDAVQATSGTVTITGATIASLLGVQAVSGTVTVTGSTAPLYLDTDAPEASPLAVLSRTTTTITLTWTAPHDNGSEPSSGPADSYDVRYDVGPTITYATATQAVGEPTPGTPGTTEIFTVSGLSSSTQYTFGLQTSDEVGNLSPITTVTATTLTPGGPADNQMPKGVSVLRGTLGRLIR